MKQTLTLACLAGANVLVTLLFQWYVITQLGVGVETDALFAAMALPQLVLSVVSSSLTYVLVPLLAVEDESTFRQNAWGFFLGISSIFTTIAFVLFISAAYWVPWLVPGFSKPGQLLTVTLTRMQLVSMTFTASVSVLWSVYRAQQRFIWVELSGLLSSMIGLVLLIKILPIFGVVGAAFLILLRAGLQVVWLLPGLGRWQRPDWSSQAMREAWRRLRPLLAGTSYYRTDSLVDRFLSSMAGPGALSLLYLGQQLYGVAAFVLEKSISAPMVPMLAKKAGAGDWLSFRDSFRRRLVWVALVTTAGYAVFLFAGQSILSLLIGHGGVTRDNVNALWVIMVALAGFLIGGAMGQISAATFYAKGDTRTPTRLGIWTYTLYIPIKVLLFLRYGLVGLAASASVYVLFNLALQVVILEKRFTRTIRG